MSNRNAYREAHRRVYRAKGKASAHKCLLCGKSAQHWAYDHLDPDQIDSPVGPFSESVEHYWPMCVSCHLTVDRSRSRRLRGEGYEADRCPSDELPTDEAGELHTHSDWMPTGRTLSRRTALLD